MMWFIFVSILVIAMMIGPIMMMQPSKRQRRVAALRQKALTLGLKVRTDYVERGGKKQEFPVYYRPWPPLDERQKSRRKRRRWRLLRLPYTHEIHFHDSWHWEGESLPGPDRMASLKELVKRLPESVVGVEADANGLGCFWCEKGGEETLQALADWLAEGLALLGDDTELANGSGEVGLPSSDDQL